MRITNINCEFQFTKGPSRHASAGFTLVEILVASLLGLILLAGLLQISTSMVQNHRLSSASLTLQSNGRYLLNTIASAVRQRGFQGCLPPVRRDPEQTSPITWFDASYITTSALRWPTVNWAKGTLRGFSVSAGGNWHPDPSDGAASFGFETDDIIALKEAVAPYPVPVSGSDVLSMQYAGAVSVPLGSNMLPADPIYVESNLLNFAPSNLILVGDCQVADLVAISKVTPSGTGFNLEHDILYNATADLKANYTALNGTVRKVYSRTFYLAETGRQSPDGIPVQALYAYDIRPIAAPDAAGLDNHEAHELVAGVEALRVLYGVANAAGTIAYGPPPVDADDATTNYWQNVKSIKIGVLLRTLEPVPGGNENRVYQVLDRTYGSPSSSAMFKHQGGNYLRDVFTATMQLKNRSM